MKKIFSLLQLQALPLIGFAIIFIASALHRGGISFQSHLLWMIGLFPIAALAIWQNKRKDNEASTPALLLSLSLLFTLSIFAGWLHSDMKDFGIITVTTELGGVATLLIMLQCEFTKEKVEKILDWLSGFAAILCSFGLTLYISTPSDRLASTFSHLPYLTTSYPNAFALFLISLLPHALIQLQESIKTKRWIMINVLLLSSLLLTFSRGGLIVGIGIIGILLIIKKLTFSRKLAILFGITLIITLTFQFARPNTFDVNSFQSKYTLSSGEKTTSVDERIGFWKGAIEIIKKNPLMGTGPDTFRYEFPAYQTSLLASSDHPHNMLLKQASEFGIPSALLLLAIMLYAFSGLKKTWKDGTHLALSLGILGIVGHNMIDYNLNFTTNAILFWAFMGALISLTKRNFTGSPERATKAVILLLTLLLFAGGGYETYQRSLIVQARSAQAENIFSNIHPLFYEDASLLQVEAAIKKGNNDLAKKTLQKIILRNTKYADPYNLLSEIFLKEKKTPEAEKMSAIALKLDPWNNLRYQYQAIKIEKEKVGAGINKEKHKTLLETYLGLLRNNAHETVRSDNPKYAIKIAELLGYTDLRNALTEAAENEREKFFTRFQIPLNPLE